METLGWLVAYVVGFALVQLLLYRYIQRDDASPDATPGAVDRPARRSIEQSTRRPEDGGGDADNEGLRCRHCGTVNDYDQPYTYCEECVQPLQ